MLKKVQMHDFMKMNVSRTGKKEFLQLPNLSILKLPGDVPPPKGRTFWGFLFGQRCTFWLF